MHKRIAIAGIHTGTGKTIASAVLAEALGADYWKPVQAGNLEDSDSNVIRQLVSGATTVFPEAVVLTEPMSPHAAAAIDKVEIDHTKFVFPETDKTLLIETAGGLLSPMYGNVTMADFISYHQLPVILVSSNYLGSINHTLLTIEILKGRNIPILALVMSGKENKSSEEYIEQYSGLTIAARIPWMEELTNEAVQQCAAEIKEALQKTLNNEP